MGRASSAKKVARAARAGGAASSSKRRFGFPAAIALICVLGLALVIFARTNVFGASAAEAPVANRDHWHAAYGFYVCDAFLPPLVDEGPDTTGLHTHGDGLIHIHPFLASAAGKNATLGKWGETVGVEFGDSSFTVDGTTYADGYDCAGTPATVAIYEWPAGDPNAEPTVHTSGFADIHLGENQAVFTFAVVPPGTDVPRTPSEGVLGNLDPATDNTLQPLDELMGGDPSVDAGGGDADVEVVDPAEAAPDPSTP